MKKILLVILAVTITLTLVACAENSNGTTKEPTNKELFEGGMEYLGTSNSVAYYRDTVTDVMYACYHCLNAGGLTEMSDPETGLPLTYTRYLELQSNGGNNK